MKAITTQTMEVKSEKVERKSWRELLEMAVAQPGTISAAYSAFHNYSAANQMLAMFQCVVRGLRPGPLCTYRGWQAKGRQVRKGEKALTLCMPITIKKPVKVTDESGEEQVTFEFVTAYVYRPRWFVLCQTDGQEFQPPPVPGWDREMALSRLGIEQVEFDELDGNMQGFAQDQRVAINPLAADPNKTLVHEIAHILLGHTGTNNDAPGNSALCEVEAEAVTLLVCESLGIGDPSNSRGYIQAWMRRGGERGITEQMAQRIFATADKIIKAGRSSSAQTEDEE